MHRLQDVVVKTQELSVSESVIRLAGCDTCENFMIIVFVGYEKEVQSN